MKSFRQYVTEEVKEAVFTFGRFNPPTTGHEKLLDAVTKVAGRNKYFVYASHSNDPKKNPLDYKSKVKFMRKMFPRHARNIILDTKARTVFDIVVKLYNDGFNKVTMVVGSDRVKQFQDLINRYNNVKGRHGFYNFDEINIVSAGERDPDADDVSGMSASKMRAAADANDYDLFVKGLPRGFKGAKDLFNAVRKGMGLKESHDFRKHIKLESVSEDREAYVAGELFKEGDVVEYKEQIGQVIMLGANYVMVESCDGERTREWISDVKLMERKDKETGQPQKYMSGIKKKDKKARDAHFERGAKMSDDDPKAYKPAPGDKDAKTKPSQYTKKYKQMFGEDVSQQQLNDLEKFGDRLLKKLNIDIEFTKHFADRMNDPRNKPAIKVQELQKLFKKIKKNKGKQIKQHGDTEAVLKDLQSDLNLPVVVNYDKNKDEFEVVNKTIMRKKNFRTTSPVLSYENYESSFEGVLVEDVKKALKNKSEKTGVAYGILKKVYDRGVAAWRTGHRPGTTPQQWGLARVNSFVTGGKTQKTTDADLWRKHKGIKEELEVSDGLGAWIDDFMKSNAPQFVGKSAKKKKKMAIAAFLDAGGKLE